MAAVSLKNGPGRCLLDEFVHTSRLDLLQQTFCRAALHVAHLRELAGDQAFAHLTGIGRRVIEQELFEGSDGVGAALAAHAALVHHAHEVRTAAA